MKRKATSSLHAIAGILAFLLILSFFLASLVCELSGNLTWLLQLKKIIFFTMWAMVILVPAAAFTGNELAGKSKDERVEKKRGRMRWIAPNGMILLSLASFLFYKVSKDEIDLLFYAAQVAELIVGAINILLLGLMIRDGFRLTRRFKAEPVTRS